jgi:hypothetical protein
MSFDLQVKLAVYRHFAETARAPQPDEIALRAQRVLVLEEDAATIRMAPPFSGVPTQHVAVVDGRRYFANCAWDVLGVPAALRQPGLVESRCEQSGEPFRLEVSREGPAASGWLFHCLVPASHWWDDIVFT